LEGTDAHVYVVLSENNKISEKIWLNSKCSISNNSDLFEAGQIDEFLIKTKVKLNKLTSLTIGHDNSGPGSGWHLKQVI
jgi:hypothetical protein